jgi:hypothetical protein
LLFHVCLLCHPNQGPFQVDVGWTQTALQLPGVYFESDQAGYPPIMTDETIITSSEDARAPTGMIGGVYYPGQTITVGSGGASGLHFSAFMLAITLAVTAVLAVW